MLIIVVIHFPCLKDLPSYTIKQQLVSCGALDRIYRVGVMFKTVNKTFTTGSLAGVTFLFNMN